MPTHDLTRPGDRHPAPHPGGPPRDTAGRSPDAHWSPGDVRDPGDEAVGTLLACVPELHPAYLELMTLADGDPGAPAVFAELAELVAGWLSTVGQARPVLDRAFEALEAVAETAGEEALELVGYAFFDNLSPDHQRVAQPWIGPCTRRVMELLDS